MSSSRVGVGESADFSFLLFAGVPLGQRDAAARPVKCGRRSSRIANGWNVEQFSMRRGGRRLRQERGVTRGERKGRESGHQKAKPKTQDLNPPFFFFCHGGVSRYGARRGPFFFFLISKNT